MLVHDFMEKRIPVGCQSIEKLYTDENMLSFDDKLPYVYRTKSKVNVHAQNTKVHKVRIDYN
jgi:peptide deformylase